MRPIVAEWTGPAVDTAPTSAPRELPRRTAQLFAGLVLYGFSDALLVRGGLGLPPWDVLHQGLARNTSVSIGGWVVLIGLVVLLLWIPLRQRPGFGTISNVILIGVVLDASLAVLGAPRGLPLRSAYLVVGVALNAVATAAYIGARLGPGPRDGLMTGLARRGYPIRVVRTSIEVAVLAMGWALGGTIGLGTVLYAAGIGPMVHLLLPRLTVPDRAIRPSSTG